MLPVKVFEIMGFCPTIHRLLAEQTGRVGGDQIATEHSVFVFPAEYLDSPERL